MIDLQRRVRDPEALGDRALDVAAEAVAVLPPADQDVRGQRVEPRGDPPDVEVVDARHAGDLDDCAGNLVGVDARRRLLHQDRRRVAEDAPRARQDQHRDCDGDDRVDRVPAGEQDHERRDQHSRGAEQVRDDVPERRLDVQALPARADEDCRRAGVHGEPGQRHEEHPPAQDLGRVVDAADRLPDDPAAHEHECEAVHEGGQDLGPLEAEAASSARRAPGEADGAEREPDREDVRDHVTGVGEEREAAREDPADDLDDREGEREDENRDERPPRRAAMVVRVPVLPQVTVGVRLAHRFAG